MTRKELVTVCGEPDFIRVSADDAARIMERDRCELLKLREQLKTAADPARIQFFIELARLSINLEKRGLVIC